MMTRLLAAWLALGASLSPSTAPPEPPKTPKGLARCAQPLVPEVPFTASVGETLRYDVEVMGVAAGSIDLEVHRQGTFGGIPVTEYRSEGHVASAVNILVPIEFRAAAVVSQSTALPLEAMHRYRVAHRQAEERERFGADGLEVRSKRKTPDGASDAERRFGAPVYDFLSAVYFLRSLAPEQSGCAVLYGNQKAYTVWIEHDGEEHITTSLGKRRAERYRIRYGADDAKTVRRALLWIDAGPTRLPLRAEVQNSYKPRLELAHYTAR